MVSFIANIESAGFRANGDSAQYRRKGFRLGFNGLDRSCFAVGVSENMDYTGIAARHKNSSSIFTERESIPDLGQWQELGHALRRDLEQGQAGVAKPSACC